MNNIEKIQILLWQRFCAGVLYYMLYILQQTLTTMILSIIIIYYDFNEIIYNTKIFSEKKTKFNYMQLIGT